MPTKTMFLAAVALAGAVVLSGCAAEPTAAKPEKNAAETPSATPEPTFTAGNIVDAAQAEAINADTSDTTVAYPVGDGFVVVSWGKPIAPAVREAVNANVNEAAGSDYGVSTDSDVSAEDWGRLKAAMTAESERLGGITLTAVSCVQSFSTAVNSHRPTWVISEPGPIGEYASYRDAHAKAEAWSGGDQEGKRLYVVINNLGCTQ